MNELIDGYTAGVHLAMLGCTRGVKCKLHAISVEKTRRELVRFMGEVLDVFEVAHFGDPLPEEQRMDTEYLAGKVEAKSI